MTRSASESSCWEVPPCGMQVPSANSQSEPLVNLLFGQATGPVGPCVVGFWQTPVVRLQLPSPVTSPPPEPPVHVSDVCVSLNDCPPG